MVRGMDENTQPAQAGPAGRNTGLNALADQSSPYLLQHAGQPVDWRPWGGSALAEARRLGRPVLLSIGYSACHWCHVMARESFQCAQTAALMNAHFVNIKVDREERPDLDALYQLAHQVLTGRPGGWPLTVFLLPEDQSPFHAGTYFPPSPRWGMPGFRQLLEHIARLHARQPGQLARQGQGVRAALDRLDPPDAAAGAPPEAAPLQGALEAAANHFDARDGGFGGAPKFPHPASLEYLLRHCALSAEQRQPDTRARHMLCHSLERMAIGGIHDQIGGGFARYATDALWMIPHFEKMLCDNAGLLALYAGAWRLDGRALFRRTACGIAEWALREIRLPEGGFGSALSAESEGQEGAFYTWSREELAQGLGEPEAALAALHYGFDRPANFHGRWLPWLSTPAEVLAEQSGQDIGTVNAVLERARHQLWALRARRPRPERDDKVLSAWNALMAKGLAVAGQLLERPDWVAAAGECVDFLHDRLWQGGRLLASWRAGRAQVDGCLDSYAYLLDALLALLEARWRRRDLDFAITLADAMLARFEDPARGGFYFSAADGRDPPFRRLRRFSDDALPSAAGVATTALGRLGRLLGEARYLEAAEHSLRAAAPALRDDPFAHCALLAALEEHCHPPALLVLRGEADLLAPWRAVTGPGGQPRRCTLAIAPGETALPGLLGERTPRGGVTAWLCRGRQCAPPITRLQDLAGALQAD